MVGSHIEIIVQKPFRDEGYSLRLPSAKNRIATDPLGSVEPSLRSRPLNIRNEAGDLDLQSRLFKTFLQDL